MQDRLETVLRNAQQISGSPAITNSISSHFEIMADPSRRPRPSAAIDHTRRAADCPEVSHCSCGAKLARADQSTKLPTARATSAEFNALTLNTATETLRAILMHERPEQFSDLGGCITRVCQMHGAMTRSSGLWF